MFSVFCWECAITMVCRTNQCQCLLLLELINSNSHLPESSVCFPSRHWIIILRHLELLRHVWPSQESKLVFGTRACQGPEPFSDEYLFVCALVPSIDAGDVLVVDDAFWWRRYAIVDPSPVTVVRVVTQAVVFEKDGDGFRHRGRRLEGVVGHTKRREHPP